MFQTNSHAKISAICGGLAAGSLVLFVASCLEVDTFLPGLVIDDLFFGQRLPYVAVYCLVDAVLMWNLAVLIKSRTALAVFIGLVWTSFVFVETLFDVPRFAYDLHLLLEEVLFAIIYAVLLVLLVVHWLSTVRVGSSPSALS